MKATQAKALLRDPGMQQVGWLDSIRALYQSTDLPTLTYSAPAWIRMNKKTKGEGGGHSERVLVHIAGVIAHCQVCGNNSFIKGRYFIERNGLKKEVRCLLDYEFHTALSRM